MFGEIKVMGRLGNKRVLERVWVNKSVVQRVWGNKRSWRVFGEIKVLKSVWENKRFLESV